MSNTLLAWLVIYGVLVVVSFRRAAWGIALYLLTYYASPNNWWWGDNLTDTLGNRVNIVTALIFVMIVLFHASSNMHRLTKLQRTILLLLVMYAANATLVHFLFAANPPRSLDGMTMIWKQVGLLFLIMVALRDRFDVNILIGSIVIGSLYIAYEIVFNDRGNFSGGRLEGIGAAGAFESNYLAGLMLLAIPLAGYWLFYGTWKTRVIAVVSLVLVFESLLRCSSRGAFLAIIAAGGWLLYAARGKARRYAIGGICLGLIACFFMVKDENINERFKSIFVSSEERDSASQSRLDYWSAAVNMVSGHPLGSGAEAAFKSDLGVRYLSQKGVFVNRAVHNGYLDILASWGVQGFVIYLGVIVLAWSTVARACRNVPATDGGNAAFLGACIQSALVGQLVVCVFISSLDGEWFFWCFVLAAAFERIYLLPQSNRVVCPISVDPSDGEQWSVV